MPRQPRAYSYVRFSTMTQSKGASLRRQIEKSEEWSRRKGIPLDDSLRLSDLGVSAYRGKNKEVGALADFVSAIETGRVLPGDYLIVESLDRISREGLYLGQKVIGDILASGIIIVTLSPEREFSSSGQNDIGQSFEIAMVLYRAWEESNTKSQRVGDAWKKKREKATTQILTSRCPSWLRPKDDRTGFDIIEDKTAIVKRIFRLAESMGSEAIAKTLDNEGVQPISGRGKKWSSSSIKRILKDKSVIGIYQPHMRTKDRREPTGTPITDYFPSVISENRYYKVQKAIADRKLSGGPATKKISNLFTKLVVDAAGNPLRYKESTEQQTYLRSDLTSIPYQLLEKSMIIWAKELDFSAVLPNTKQDVANSIPDIIDTIDGLTNQIEEVAERIKSGKKAGVLLDLLENLGDDKERAIANLEAAKVEASNVSTDALSTIKDVIDIATDVQTRSRLRRALQRVIKQIEVKGREYSTGIQFRKIIVTLHNGNKWRFNLRDTELTWQPHLLPVDDKQSNRITVKAPPGITVIGSLDVQRSIDLAEIYPELARYRTDGNLIREILELDKLKLTHAEIAEMTSTTHSKVAKALLKAGRRRIKQHDRESPYVMNWHEAGRGWVKSKTINGKKKRHFIGCGKLRKLYPKLCTDTGSHEEQTYRAANQWWADNMPK